MALLVIEFLLHYCSDFQTVDVKHGLWNTLEVWLTNDTWRTSKIDKKGWSSQGRRQRRRGHASLILQNIKKNIYIPLYPVNALGVDAPFKNLIDWLWSNV